jgi:S-sulfosulfanyl-L-cysteine sulfohydrolase
MKVTKELLLGLSIVTTGASCTPQKANVEKASDAVSSISNITREQSLGTRNVETQIDKKIRFLHYNDLHAHLTQHLELVRGPNNEKIISKRGGLSRLKTRVDELRAEVKNSIFMNVGDTYHGGVEASFTYGNAIIAPVNAMGIDIGVPGNWDFAYGPAVTRLRYTNEPLTRIAQMMAPDEEILKPNFLNIAANVKYDDSRFNASGLAGKTMLKATHIIEKDGVKVGFIGLTSDMVQDMHTSLARGLIFLQEEQAYIDLINSKSKELKAQGANIVVVMSELSVQKDLNLANKIEIGAIDAFFSAHTHEATFEPLVSQSGAYVVEAGSDAYLGVMDVTVRNGKVISKIWKLEEITDSIPENQIVKDLVAKARAPFLGNNVHVHTSSMMGEKTLIRDITTVIGKTAHPIDRKHALESDFNNAFTDLMRKKGNTHMALTPGFRFDNPIAAHGAEIEDNVIVNNEITLEDIYRFFPVEFTLATGKVTGSRLKEIMEDNLRKVYSKNVHEQRGGWFDGYSGLKIKVDLAAENGSRVLEIKRKMDNGQLPSLVTPSTELTVTGCKRMMDDEDVLCSYSGFYDTKDIIKEGTTDPMTNIDLLEEAFSTGELLYKNKRKDIEDINDTPLWPFDTFVQPISGAGN